MDSTNSTNTCFRVVTQWFVPFSSPQILPNGELHSSGLIPELLTMLTRKYGKCYKIVDWNELCDMVYPNGTVGGIMGQLSRNEIDIMGSVMSPHIERMNIVAFSEWVIRDSSTFIYKKPAEEVNLDGFMKPYTWTVWYWFFGTLAVITLLNFCNLAAFRSYLPPGSNEELTVNHGVERQKEGIQLGDKLQQSFIHTLAVLLAQGTSLLREKSPSVTCLFVSWLWGSLFLSMVYKNNLVAMLITKKVKIPFDSTEEYVAQDKIQAVSQGNAALYHVLKNSEPTSTGGKLFRKLVPVKDFPEGMAMLRKGYAGFTAKQQLYSIIGGHFAATRTCPYYVVKQYFRQSSLHIAFSKEFPLLKKFNRDIRNLREAGLIEFMLKRIQRYAYYCINAKEENVLKPLNIQNFYGAFLLWATGLVLGFLQFLIEIFSPPKGKRQIGTEVEIMDKNETN